LDHADASSCPHPFLFTNPVLSTIMIYNFITIGRMFRRELLVREPVVAGQFYPADPKRLVRDIDKLISSVPDKDKIGVVGAVSPHAGYMYSGGVAGEVYSRIMPKNTYVILGPNHTGYGGRFSMSLEAWRTPLGQVDVNMDLAEAIREECPLIREDTAAHAMEHSIEVQLPFIQRISPEAKVVPLTVRHGGFDEISQVGSAIAAAVRSTGADAVIIASSDMTHYEPRVSASAKDRKAIEKMLSLDAEGLIETVEYDNISMCGYVPAAIMIVAAKLLGAKNAELVRYCDSGDVTGETNEVVGYAGMVVY
jgi:MEMO1 family protein